MRPKFFKMENHISSLYKESEEYMEKSVSIFDEELKSLRAGRATISLVDKIKVEYYGTSLNLNQIATLSTPDTKTIAINLWDKNVAPNVIKALQQANLGINPIQEQDNLIKLYFPPLSQERRRDLVRLTEKRAEEAKVAVRNIRRHINAKIKLLEEEGKISEDDAYCAQNEIQKITDSFIKKINEILANKKKEIMET